MADIVFENHGSVVLISGQTDAGREWLELNVMADDVMTVCGAIACEPRHAWVIASGAMEDGLTCE